MNKSAAKRLSRIRRRAIPAVQEAFARGELSARRADILLYQSADQQQAWLAEHQARELRYSRAAAAIQKYLANLQGARPRLDQLALAIQKSQTDPSL